MTENNAETVDSAYHALKTYIAAMIRFHTVYGIYGLKNLAKKLFDGLEVGVKKCTEYDECAAKYPYKLPIICMLQKAMNDLQL